MPRIRSTTLQRPALPVSLCECGGQVQIAKRQEMQKQDSNEIAEEGGWHGKGRGDVPPAVGPSAACHPAGGGRQPLNPGLGHPRPPSFASQTPPGPSLLPPLGPAALLPAPVAPRCP